MFLTLTFLFAIGSMFGWELEVLFRRCVTQKKWENPGFLTGPCLPLYGFSLCILYIFTQLEHTFPVKREWVEKIILFALMAIAITALEYLIGNIMLYVAHIRLWDYFDCKWNINGIICPQYTFYWMLLSAVYYFLIHPHTLNVLEWLSHNLAFSFGIGFFYGILVIDVVYSGHIMNYISEFADKNKIVIRLESLRKYVQEGFKQRKPRFLLSLKPEKPLSEILEQYKNKLSFSKKIIVIERHCFAITMKYNI